MTVLIIFTVVFLLLSGFFSGSETGLTSASRAKIHKLKMEGDKKAERMMKLLENKDKLITTILLGNTFVNIAASALVTKITLVSFGESEEALYIATIILTIIILVFAEVLPKTYSFKNSEKVALTVSPIFMVLVKILTPITYIVSIFVRFFARLLKLDKTDFSAMVNGLDVIRGAIEMHHEQGEVIKEDRDMLGGILDLEHIEVEEVMRHRKDMETIDINLDKKDFVERILNSPYSRIPVYEDNPDNIIGVIHAKALMRAINVKLKGDIEKLNIKQIMKEAWFVPDVTTLKDQLIAFREKQNHFALVVDEYGSLLGLITLEDILEEIVGNIEDETDIQYHTIEEKRDGKFTVQGSIPIRDLNREMNWNLPTDEANTIAGLIIHEAQMIPNVGQIFNFYGFRFKIRKKKKNQILKIEIQTIDDE